MSYFDCIKLPFRTTKPRDVGITMVLDKDRGLDGVRNLIETAGGYVDVIKFG